MKNYMNSLKRVLSMVMVIAMIMTMLPMTASAANISNGAKVYFQTDWTNSCIQLMVGHSSWSQGYKMTKESGTTDIYGVTMPSWSGATQLAVFGTDGEWEGEGSSITHRKNWAPNSTDVVSLSSNLSGTKSYVISNSGIKELKYTVSFNANGGTGSMDAVSNAKISYTLPACGFTAPAYKVFAGWSTKADGPVIDGTTIKSLSNITLYAIWKADPAYFAVEVSGSENGTVTADKQLAKKGETVTLTVTPEDGFELDTLTVKQGSADVAVENNAFTMPEGNVTVNATFKKLPAIYDVTFNGTNVGSNGNEEAIEGEPYITTLTAAQGYTLPESVTVTVGGNEITTHTFKDGVLTIPAESVTGDIVITAVGVKEQKGITVYFINSGKWAKVNAYAWNSAGNNAWPGAAMTKTGDAVNGFDIYSITFEKEYVNIIFNNGSTQTADLTLQAGKYYDYKAGKWYGSLEDVPQVDPTVTDTVLVGDFNSWNANANPFKLNAAGEKVGYVSLELAANTTYGFKLIKSGTWLGNNGTITGSISGWVFDAGSGNCTFKTAEAGTYVFAFNLANNQVSVTYPQVAEPVTYTVIFNGTNVTSSNAATSVEEKTAYTTTLKAAEGYTLPESVTVTMGGKTVEGAYNAETGVITISNVTGDIVITAAGVEIPAEPETITVYFLNNWKWSDVKIHFWGSAAAEDTAWPGMAMTKVGMDGSDEVYAAEIPADVAGLIINGLKDDNSGNRDQTPNIETGIADGKGWKMFWNNGNHAENYDYKPGSGEETGTEYYLYGWLNGADVAGNVHKFVEGKLNITFTAADNYVFVKDGSGASYMTNGWLGQGVTTATLGTSYTTGDKLYVPAGTYEFTLVENEDGTLTLSVGEPGDDEEDEGDKTTYTVTFHFANTLGWSPVNLYVWNDDGATTGSWPGAAMTARDENGYFTMTVSYEAATNQGLGYIFNNGTAQTVDLKLDAAAFDATTNTAEIWIELQGAANSEGKYESKQIDDEPLANIKLAVSPKVEGDKVTFEYVNDTAASVKVMGSFDNWETGISMTKNEKGLWTATLENLPYGIYEYKFLVNGTEWVNDPANGVKVGDNNAFTIMNPNAEDTNTVKVIVTYTRTDGNYENWNIAAWDAPGLEEQYDFEVKDGVATTTITLDGRATQTLGFKIRKSVGSNKWAQQSGEFRVNLGDIVSGTIYVNINNDFSAVQSTDVDIVVGNKIKDIQLDYDKNTVAITTNKGVANAQTAFLLCKDQIDTGIVESVTVSGNTYTLNLSEALSLKELYKYSIHFTEDTKYANFDHEIGIDTVYASKKFASEFTYEGKDQGATWTAASTTFRVWAPTAESVSVKLYTSGTKGTDDCIGTYPMTADVNGTWVVTVGGNLNGTYYTYAVTVNGETVEAVDPYARTTGVNGNRGMVINLDSTDPAGWGSDGNPNKISSQTDAVIYELHVRDFSIDASSGMTNKGKYLAFTEEGTVIPGTDVSTGVDYLASLGITHLHLLPVYDYGSVDETKSNSFNWGYDPVNYNVPEGSYSTNPYDGAARVNEFKQMVQSLHNNGISVVMDVVYNHVYDSGKFCFNNIVPGYFSRPNSNTSGCGNDTASEREMVRKYIVESVLYWHQEYHIDGFRFDLVGLLDVETINEIVETVHACCPDVIFYGEGWDMDGTNKEPGTQMAKQGNASKTPGFAYFSDSIRNNLGGNNGHSTGFASGAGNGGAIAADWLGQPWWTSTPEQVIQYASCHDNYTLADKLIISTKANGVTANIIKMNNLAAAFYMTAQGVPFIHAHEEVLREKLEEGGGRSENSYNASDFVNHLDWNDLVKYADNVAYYQGLIAFRAANPALRYATSAEVKANVHNLVTEANMLVYRVDANGTADKNDEDILVIFNAGGAARTVDLPEGEWTIYVNDKKAGTQALGTAEGSVTVAGISAMVLTTPDKGEDGSGPSAEKTIYFSNNKHWNTVYAYAWTGDTYHLGAWPGVQMEYVETNTYGEKVYRVTLPASAEGIDGLIFHNNAGTQTVDLVPGSNNTGYYCTDANEEGKFACGTYAYQVPGDPAEYYLIGYINGVDYTGLDYKFNEDGEMKITFSSDSYVYVANGDNSEVYMTDGYQGAVTSAILKDTAKCQLTKDKWDKLLIPGGVEATIKMVKNNDNTVTLSYSLTLSGVEDTSGIQNGMTLHCWNWSFKEIEKNMETIAEMGFTAIQTSPVQAMKEATTGKAVGTNWWVYYQPVDFVITNEDGNALGTKAELESMIKTAHEHGVKVIVDVVANHLGNQRGNDLSEKIPEYLRNSEYWHDITANITNWNDRYNMTQYCLDGLPDLNTANKKIQGYVLNFLKECIDIGVDGFRFDMAKSIETPDDASGFASDFWPTVIGGAEEYAAGKGKDVYMYGEVLDNPAIAVSAYTKYMAVTDNSWGNNLRGSIAAGKANLEAGYHKAANASNLVIWAESHDTYANESSSGVSEANINKTWALVAARADIMGLYLARPEVLTQELGVASVTGWANDEVGAVNKFHNDFHGQSEKLSNENGISYVERGTTGVVLVNTAGGKKEVSVTAQAMADGTYIDQITGETFTVANGKISGTIGDTGIAVVYNAAYETELEVSASGSASLDKPNAKPGETVTITVKPDEGCKVDSVTVKDAKGNTLTLTENTDGTYSFVSPVSDVTIEVVFKTDYKVIAGDKASADLDEVKDLTFKVNAALSKFQSLKLNGNVVNAVNYTLSEGSTVVTLKASYLKMMEAGTYTLTFVFSDGEVSGTFTLTKDTDEEPEETTKPSEKPEETTKPSEKPEETTKPSEKPEETTKPSDETTESTGSTTEGTVAPTVPRDDTNVPTGDTSFVVMFAVMMILSAAAFVALLSKRKAIR